MGYIKIWVHVVWTTKNHKPLLSKDIRQDIFKHINENASKKNTTRFNSDILLTFCCILVSKIGNFFFRFLMIDKTKIVSLLFINYFRII